MKRVLVVSLSVIFLMGWLGFSEAAMCDGCSGMRKHGMGNRTTGMGMPDRHALPGMIASLGLDDKQKEEIESIHFRCKKEAIRKRAAVAVAQLDLKEILGKEPVDMSAAEAKIKEIEAIKADLRILHMRSIEEIKTTLTPEQKKKFISLLGSGQMGGMGMRDGMMGMRGNSKGKCGMRMGMGYTDSDDDDVGDGQPSTGAEQP